jgi:hypothetical protein
VTGTILITTIAITIFIMAIVMTDIKHLSYTRVYRSNILIISDEKNSVSHYYYYYCPSVSPENWFHNLWELQNSQML